MKIHGKKLSGPNIEVIAIPRQSGDIIFKAQAVLDYKDFDSLNPVPKPPQIMRPGGITSFDVEDKDYKTKLRTWSLSKTDYMVLKSLSATPGLEWEDVNMSEPETWVNYRQEMQDSGLSPAEVSRIVDGVASACGLNQEKIDEATKRFLALEAAQAVDESSPEAELSSTPPGELANA